MIHELIHVGRVLLHTDAVHQWGLFCLGHGMHVMKRAGLAKQSKLNGVESRAQWFRCNASALSIRFFVNILAFSYWQHNPDIATRALGAIHIPMNLSLPPSNATAGLFGLSGDSLLDWATAKSPALQKEIPPQP